MYRKRKNPSKRRSRRRSITQKSPCKRGERRSRSTGRCGKYVRIIKTGTSKVLCKKRLSAKIKKNMEELEAGRFYSKAQSLAVSYSQINKKYPGCKRYFSRY
jgi:hypothetical protein